MSLGFELLLFALAFVAAILGGILGMAGGVFLVPLILIFAHVDIHHAIGASIVSVIACSCAGSSTYLENRLANIKLAVVLEVMTTLGALTGVLLSGILPVPWLFGIFALILALSAQQMLSRRHEEIREPEPVENPSWARANLSSSYPDSALGREVPYIVDRLGLGLSLMYGAGLISALLGIGSGVLKIPAMDTALRLPIKVSSATSNFMIGVTASASAAAYFVRGDIDAALTGPIVLGSVLGSILGAKILLRAPGEKIRVFFVFVLLGLALQMLLSAFGIVHLGGGE